jgi:hypothetical protein
LKAFDYSELILREQALNKAKKFITNFAVKSKLTFAENDKENIQVQAQSHRVLRPIVLNRPQKVVGSKIHSLKNLLALISDQM